MRHSSRRFGGRWLLLGLAAAGVWPLARAGGNLEVSCSAPILSSPTCMQNEIVDLAWAAQAQPVRWWMNDRGVHANDETGGSPISASLVLDELSAAFSTWESLQESSIAFQSQGMTSQTAIGIDGVNLVRWWNGETDIPPLSSGTLAVTSYLALPVDWLVGPTTRNLDADPALELDPAIYPDGLRLRAGTIVDADVILNAFDFDWSRTPNSTPDVADIRAVATHEVGHVHGLAHSATLSELATMFAYFDTASAQQQEAARALAWDDVTASARAYPVTGVGPTGVLSGRVVRGTSTGVIGAQVSAIDVSSGRVVEAVFSNSGQKRINGTLQTSGSFRLDRLPPGSYMVSVDYLRTSMHTPGGWRWLNSVRTGYNVTVTRGNQDPVDVSPELLSPTEGSADDLSPARVVTLAAGQQVTLNNLTANTAWPTQPTGTQQLFALTVTTDDDEIIFDVPIGFPFSFFGQPYAHFAVYANGFITFGTGLGSLDLELDENGGRFFDFPRVAGLLRDLDPGWDQQSAGGPDAYVRLGASQAEAIWLAVAEKIPARETTPDLTVDSPIGANTFTIGFNSAGKVWIDYQRLSSPLGISGLSAGNGTSGVREKYDFGRSRLLFPDRPTFEGAVPLSGIRVEFTPHAQGGYVASSPQWTVPEVAAPGSVGGLSAEGQELTLLTWPAAGQPAYNVYKGSVGSLVATGAYTTDTSCLGTSSETQALDVDAPAGGQAFFYLVTGVREFGIEGTLGSDSRGVTRANAVPCRVR